MRHAIGVFIRRQGGASFVQARVERAFAGGDIGELMQRLSERRIVLGHRRVALSVGAMQIGAQTSAVENRQANRRADGAYVRALRCQIAQPQRLQAEESHQIDIPSNALRLRRASGRRQYPDGGRSNQP